MGKQQCWSNVFLDLMLPQRCRACDGSLAGRKAASLCDACIGEVRYIQKPICCRCGIELTGEPERRYHCGNCLKTPPPFNMAVSVVRYGPPVSDLLHSLKYGADTTVLPALADILRPFDPKPFNDCDYILPVPLHRRRLQQRGTNQSLLIARLLFPDRLDSIVPQFLQRNKETVPQTGLDGVARRANLRGAFLVPHTQALSDRHVCLVDDVYTTGTTVAECSRTLLQAGAATVSVVTLARVAPKH